MPSSTRWPEAALAGLACSMRTTAGPALLAARGRITGKPRIAVLALTAGELAADKTSAATDRTDLPALGGRAAAGGISGQMIAGPAGAVAGVAGGVVGTYATWRARKLVVDTTGLDDRIVAVGEDIVALAAAALATAPATDGSDPGAPDGAGDVDPIDASTLPRPEETRRRSRLRDALDGLVAGAVGTAAMTIAQGAEFVLTDAEPSSAPADVLDKASRRVGLGKLPRKRRRAANQGMHWLYGTSWGLPYGLVAGSLDLPPELTGPLFGLVVWGAALGQYPALGLAEAPWKRSLQSLGSEALFHVVYGIGVGAGWRALRPRG